MHNVEKIIDGEIVGWISGRTDGCPSSVDLSFSDRKLQLFADRTREDVLRAGHTLFSGFHLRVSAYSHEHVCQASLEGVVYDIKPSVRRDLDLIHVENTVEDYFSGWINSPEVNLTLSFFSSHGMGRAKLHHRQEVNDHLKTPPEILHGFCVKGLELSKVYALVLNNQLVHWMEPG